MLRDASEGRTGSPPHTHPLPTFSEHLLGDSLCDVLLIPTLDTALALMTQ